MSTHKHFDKICCVILAVTLIITVVFMNAESLGIEKISATAGYETRLFNTETVHSIDIVMDDWDGFLSTCTNEEYTDCAVVIDGEAYKNVAIRAKGNTSLSQVKSYGNNRYSLKIEFDHYDETNSYYGLDKLCLNNIIQDNTYMKDYLVYRMMAQAGAAAPLCSYANITVNGEEWGLYLAVEGIEEAFLQRNYGSDYGELYKPDSMNMGGGRGNGKDFEIDNWNSGNETQDNPQISENSGKAALPSESGESSEDFKEFRNGKFPSGDMAGGNPPEMPSGDMAGGNPPEMPSGDMTGGSPPEMPSGDMADGNPPEMPSGDIADFPTGADGSADGDAAADENKFNPGFNGGRNDMTKGSNDVLLKYTDDSISSYSNIFDNAKTEVSTADKQRLIESLKNLSNGEDIENTVDVESVIRYFVVHNFVLNFDSYTGSMIHNYYLYEKDGMLSMLPWDYNLAFGSFQSAGNAEELINYPIDSPVSGGSVEDRPMLAWIFASDEYTELYHQYFSEFITEFFDSGEFTRMIDSTKAMIAPYVENDPTKFCTYEEFEKGADTLKEFCLLRAESVSAQLNGTIGSTSETRDNSTFISADNIDISSMGSMNGFDGGKDRTDRLNRQ